MSTADDLPELIQRARWEIGDRIRALRLQRGLTQEQLAERIETDRRTVLRLERGYHPLNIDRAVVIAWALDVPLPRLFADCDHDTSSPEE